MCESRRDAVKAWAEQLKGTETLADVVSRLAELDEPAKVTAPEKLGEGERARRIATAWLRPKLELSAAFTDLAT
jgi:hypothetical protein